MMNIFHLNYLHHKLNQFYHVGSHLLRLHLSQILDLNLLDGREDQFGPSLLKCCHALLGCAGCAVDFDAAAPAPLEANALLALVRVSPEQRKPPSLALRRRGRNRLGRRRRGGGHAVIGEIERERQTRLRIALVRCC